MEIKEIKDFEGLRKHCLESRCFECEISKNNLDAEKNHTCPFTPEIAERTLSNILRYNRKQKLEKLLR